jgi:shikimate kinase
MHQPPSNLVFLIGYRCTGKSTVGRLLADTLRWTFVDADVELERHAGKTIREIFEEESESGFRDREEAVLEQLCQSPPKVISTGGGVILRERNRERLQGGFVVWLTASAEVIASRMVSDPSTTARRPNLTVGGLEEIRQLLAVREPFYRSCADVEISTEELSPEMVVSRILAEWGSTSKDQSFTG